MNIGENMRKARKEAGISQVEIAERLGVYQKDVSRWEKGEHTPSLEAFVAWCRITGFSADEVLELREKEKNMDKEKIIEILTAYGLSKEKAKWEANEKNTGHYIIYDYDDLLEHFEEYFPREDEDESYEDEKKDFINGKGNMFQLEKVTIDDERYAVQFIG